MEQPLLHRLAVAFGIGLIVGIERGWKTRDEHSGRRLAGFRTFALTGLLGGVLAALSEPDRLVVLAAGTLAVGSLVVCGYWISVRESGDLGMTTELAMLATFGLGAVAVLGAPFESAATAVVMTLLLGFKAESHRIIEGLDRQELLATLKILAIAAVIVPLLPDRDLGPWQAVNPRTVGMLVLLIAGLSYVGYFAVHALGARLGLLLTAFFGGLSSSTAVTVAYARRAKAAKAGHALYGAGIAIAAAAMIPRLALEISAVNASLLPRLGPTLAVLAAVPVIALALALLRRAPAGTAGIELENPLQLRAALVFAALLTVLFVAAQGAQRGLGESGVYGMAAIAGLFDVDAISLALARSAGRGVESVTAERAIALAVLVNTAAKAVLAAVLGGRTMLRSASTVLAIALVAGAATAAVTLR